MVDPHKCIVCYQVFEGAIYQCPPGPDNKGGHVICGLCIGKLEEPICPNCRQSYGESPIRNRGLEDQLDSQEFDCDFKDFGCDYKCKRAFVSSHINSCGLNPELINLCNILGWKECKFGLGACSKAQVIQHFQETHKLSIEFNAEFSLTLESIAKSIKGVKGNDCLPFLFALSSHDESPLFLLIAKVNNSTGFVSFLCFLIWEAKGKSQAYKVDFSLRREHPLLLHWTLNVYTLQEAKHTLETCPVNIPKRVLEDGLFGNNTKGSLTIKVTRILLN